MGLHWSEKEALWAQYPEFRLDLLFEVVELVDCVDRREVSAYEGTALAKARFAALMAEHLPECQARVAVYQERVTAERRKLTLEAAAYEEKRQAAIAGEKLRLEKEAADAMTRSSPMRVRRSARSAKVGSRSTTRWKKCAMKEMRRIG